MSREKVEKYKEYKANRKEILAKEKKRQKLVKMAYILVAVVFIGGIAGGIGLTAYNSYKAKLAARPNYNREELIISDLASVRTEEPVEEPLVEVPAE